MVIKVYISGMSGNKEVKKRQQRVLMILDSKSLKYEVIDITEPGRDADKEFMQNKSQCNGGTVSDPNPRHPLPPQLFNDDEYCGDYDKFDMANEMDTIEQFLKLEAPPEEPSQDENKENILNGDASGKKSKENSQERSKEGTPAKEGSPMKEGTPAKDGSPMKEGTPAKEGSPMKEGTPAKEGSPMKEGTPAKDGASREATPAKDKASKEPTPVKDDNEEAQKEPTPVKESPERQMSVDKEKSVPPENDTEAKKSKESSPALENGRDSTRASAEKEGAGDATDSKKDPSEALIANEQAASVE